MSGAGASESGGVITGELPGEASGRRAASKVRRRAALREVAYLTGLLLSAGLSYWILILLPSRLHTQELRARTEQARADVRATQERIARTQRDTAGLADDPYLIERALRKRLGYLAPGERVFNKPD